VYILNSIILASVYSVLFCKAGFLKGGIHLIVRDGGCFHVMEIMAQRQRFIASSLCMTGMGNGNMYSDLNGIGNEFRIKLTRLMCTA